MGFVSSYLYFGVDGRLVVFSLFLIFSLEQCLGYGFMGLFRALFFERFGS